MRKRKMPSVPILIKAGEEKLLINGQPPLVDCRVVAEDRYQLIKDLVRIAMTAIEENKPETAKITLENIKNHL